MSCQSHCQERPSRFQKGLPGKHQKKYLSGRPRNRTGTRNPGTSKFHFARFMLSCPPNTSVFLPRPLTPFQSPVLARPRPFLTRSSPVPRPVLARSSPGPRPFLARPWIQAVLPSKRAKEKFTTRNRNQNRFFSPGTGTETAGTIFLGTETGTRTTPLSQGTEIRRNKTFVRGTVQTENRNGPNRATPKP